MRIKYACFCTYFVHRTNSRYEDMKNSYSDVTEQFPSTIIFQLHRLASVFEARIREIFRKFQYYSHYRKSKNRRDAQLMETM